MSARVRFYHGESGAYLGSPTTDDLGTVEVSFDLHGSNVARVEIPRCSAFSQMDQHAPDGLGAFVEVDAQSLGVPDIWLGAIPTTQLGGELPSRVLDATGPALYLDEVPTGPVRETGQPAATIVRNAVQAARRSPWIASVTASSEELGRTAPYGTSATTLWKLATDLETARWEAFYITPRGGGVESDLHWMTLHGGQDFSGEVTLIAGRNCIPQPTAYGLRPKLAESLLVGQSFGLGSDVMASQVTAPDGARPMGIHDALTLALSTRHVRKLAGDHASEVLPDLDQTAQEGLDLVAEATMRRAMIPRLLQQVEVTDCALWPYLRPHSLLRVQLDDDGGVFADAVARVRTVQFRVAPTLACTISVDLWRMIG